MSRNPRMGVGLVIAFGALALLWRFSSRADSAPAWLLALAAFAGVVSTTVTWPTELGPSSPVTLMSFGIFLLLVVLERHLFLLLVGTQLATAGFLGLFTGKILVAGRVGPARAYSGRPASLHALGFLLAGVTAVVWALVS